MRRLILGFAGCTYHIVGNLMPRLKSSLFSLPAKNCEYFLTDQFLHMFWVLKRKHLIYKPSPLAATFDVCCIPLQTVWTHKRPIKCLWSIHNICFALEIRTLFCYILLTRGLSTLVHKSFFSNNSSGIINPAELKFHMGESLACGN